MLPSFTGFSDVSRQNLGIVVLEKQAGVWEGGGCCEQLVGLGQSAGWVPGSFLIHNTSFILDLDLIISMTLMHNSISIMKLSKSKPN